MSDRSFRGVLRADILLACLLVLGACNPKDSAGTGAEVEDVVADASMPSDTVAAKKPESVAPDEWTDLTSIGEIDLERMLSSKSPWPLIPPSIAPSDRHMVLWDDESDDQTGSPELIGLYEALKDKINLGGEEALLALTELKEAVVEAEGDRSARYADILSEEAVTLYEMSRNDEAYSRAQMAKSIFDTLGYGFTDPALDNYGSLIVIAEAAGEDVEVIDAMHKAYFDDLVAAVGVPHAAIAATLSDKGAALYGKRQREEAALYGHIAALMGAASLEREDPEAAEAFDGVISALSNQAVILSGIGRKEMSYPLHEKAVTLTETHRADDIALRAGILHNYGASLSSGGYYEDGQRVLQRALEFREEAGGRDHPETAQTLAEIGFGLAKMERFREAEAIMLRASDVLLSQEATAYKTHGLIARTNAVRMMREQGDVERAIATMEDTLPLQRTFSVPEGKKSSLLYRSSLSQLVQLERDLDVNSEKARSRIDELLDLLRSDDTETSSARLKTELFALDAFSDDGTRAQRLPSEGEKLQGVAFRYMARGGTVRGSVIQEPLEFHGLLSAEADQWDMALASFQLARQAALSDAVASALALRNSAESEIRELRLAQRDAETDLQKAEAALRTAVAQSDATARTDAEATLEQARLLVSETRQALEELSGDTQQQTVGVVSLESIQARLGPKDVVMLPSFRRAAPFTILIGRNEANVVRLDAKDISIREGIKTYRSQLDDGDLSRTLDFSTADRLGEMILSEKVRKHLPDEANIFLWPDPMMESLPLTVLRVDGRWVDELHSVTYLPGLSVFQDGRIDEDEGLTKNMRLFAMGDPLLSRQTQMASVGSMSTYFRGGEIDRGAIANLPPLPGSRDEVLTAMRGAPRNSTALLSRQATEKAIKSETLSDYGVYLFATHGLTSGEMGVGAEPGLVLSMEAEGSSEDGYLSASEIARLDLDGGLVILSACNSGGGHQTNAPGLTGLTQAFITAGADSLVVSHWRVRDDAAKALTTTFLDRLEASDHPAAALKAASKAVRKSNMPQAEDPRVWGPFAYVGQ
ncbi:MAG: CHAT domain-containing protein [Litorimonas sp.]